MPLFYFIINALQGQAARVVNSRRNGGELVRNTVATVLLAKKAQKKRAPKRPPKSCDLILQISVFLRKSGKQVAEVT